MASISSSASTCFHADIGVPGTPSRMRSFKRARVIPAIATASVRLRGCGLRKWPIQLPAVPSAAWQKAQLFCFCVLLCCFCGVCFFFFGCWLCLVFGVVFVFVFGFFLLLLWRF